MSADWNRFAPRLAAELAGVGGRLPPRLRTAWDAVIARTGFPTPDCPCPPLADLALPVFELPVWVARRARRAGTRVPARTVLDAACAAGLGYLVVRLHDDRLDEQRGDEAGALLLGSILLLEHHARLERAAGTGWPALRPAIAAAWRAYGEAMLLERELSASGRWTEPGWRASLDRFAPLVLAPGAVLARAGRARDLPALRALLDPLVACHQELEDAVDAIEDLDGGRTTWVTTTLGPDPRVAWLRGGFAGHLAEVEMRLAALAPAWTAEGLPEGARHLRRRMRAARLRFARMHDALIRVFDPNVRA